MLSFLYAYISQQLLNTSFDKSPVSQSSSVTFSENRCRFFYKPCLMMLKTNMYAFKFSSKKIKFLQIFPATESVEFSSNCKSLILIPLLFQTQHES